MTAPSLANRIGDWLTSVVRTYVALAVGALLTWLATRFHVVISPNTRDAVIVFVTAAVVAAYYALVRLLEHAWPKAGLLLGVPKAPNYAQVTADGAYVITSVEGDFTSPDPLAVDGADPNTPGASADHEPEHAAENQPASPAV